MINIIAAVSESLVIGSNNRIPWHISEDLKLFKKTTMDSVIIMGRKTFESLNKKPLPGRDNIVVSRTIKEAPGFTFFNELEKALAWASQKDREIFLIGGGEIYKKGLLLADKMFLSFVKGEYSGDVFFPEVDWDDWDLLESEEFDDFVFKVFKRK